MKVTAASVLILLHVVSVEARWVEPEGIFERTLYATSFDAVDWSSLAAVAGTAQVDDPATRTTYERNLKYIFHQKLNRRRFLVAPDPQLVVDRIVAILAANRRIGQLLGEGRRKLGSPVPDAGSRALVKEVGSTARALREQFTAFFVEAHTTGYPVHLPRSPNPAAQFSSFILQAQTISEELTRRLDDYFFAPSPGAVRIEQMQSGNIVTLAESLEVLSGAVSRSLR
ncbi:MAG: hypothetical protein Kow001_17770 [Acidobacteriota bacterium]